MGKGTQPVGFMTWLILTALFASVLLLMVMYLFGSFGRDTWCVNRENEQVGKLLGAATEVKSGKTVYAIIPFVVDSSCVKEFKATTDNMDGKSKISFKFNGKSDFEDKRIGLADYFGALSFCVIDDSILSNCKSGKETNMLKFNDCGSPMASGVYILRIDKTGGIVNVNCKTS